MAKRKAKKQKNAKLILAEIVIERTERGTFLIAAEKKSQLKGIVEQEDENGDLFFDDDAKVRIVSVKPVTTAKQYAKIKGDGANVMGSERIDTIVGEVLGDDNNLNFYSAKAIAMAAGIIPRPEKPEVEEQKDAAE